MATLRTYAENVVRLASGAIFTDESPYDERYVYDVVNSARAHVLRADYIKNRRWAHQAIQNHLPEYEQYFQDSVCYTRFELPTGFIQGNASSDGLAYFGSSTDKIFRHQNFRRIKSRNELTDFLGNATMTMANGRYVGVLIEGLIATVISKDVIKNPMIAGVFQSPQKFDWYNLDSDEYPFPPDLDYQLLEVVKNGTIKTILIKNPDYLSDSRTAPQK